ncbi:hypothetical protein EVAR_49647_1 [Eumeta japonica]|uniref:Uncharacterized protein n=1 Tax=Eumeta variegata TaxID=151549 RepID=A0A4C1YB14_EUMVA|nr:hypothetical protein EVAR_49647_1 [Eumeta japonica]
MSGIPLDTRDSEQPVRDSAAYLLAIQCPFEANFTGRIGAGANDAPLILFRNADSTLGSSHPTPAHRRLLTSARRSARGCGRAAARTRLAGLELEALV